MPRARTLRQSLALAYGRSRYRTRPGDIDLARLEARREAEHRNAPLETCMCCLGAMTDADLSRNRCPHCGELVVPF